MSYRSFSIIPPFGGNLLSDRFTQMDNLFSRLTGEKPVSDIPSYDLFQKNNESFDLIISVPGFSENELDVSILNNQLTITGKPLIKDKKNHLKGKEKVKWINKGINKNEFSLNFNLDHRISVKKSYLDKGLLSIEFIYDIPEKEKPRKISINTKRTDSGRVIDHK